MGCLITGTIAYLIIAFGLAVKFSVKFSIMLLTTPVGTFVGLIIAAYALIHGDMHYFLDSFSLISVSLVGTLVRRRVMSKLGVKVKKRPSLPSNQQVSMNFQQQTFQVPYAPYGTPPQYGMPPQYGVPPQYGIPYPYDDQSTP